MTNTGFTIAGTVDIDMKRGVYFRPDGVGIAVQPRKRCCVLPSLAEKSSIWLLGKKYRSRPLTIPLPKVKGIQRMEVTATALPSISLLSNALVMIARANKALGLISAWIFATAVLMYRFDQ